jgi:hypothetical protein
LLGSLVGNSRAVALSGCLLCALLPASAFASEEELTEKLDQAERFIEEKPLNYEEAQRLLFEVVRSGEGTPELMARAYFTLGRVEAGLEHEVESTDSFYLAMMIQPSLFLPEGASPKVRSRLNEARNRVIEVGVLEASLSLVDSVLEVHLRNDPLDLVKRMEVRMTRGEGEVGTADIDEKAPRVRVEPGVSAIQVVLFDELGNQLRVLALDPSNAESSADINPSTIRRAPTLWESWGLWAGVAGVLAGGGVYFTMEAGSLQDDLDAAQDAAPPDPVAVRRLQDDKDRVGLYGVVGFSLAGAAAAAAGWFLLTGGGDAPTDNEAADVALVPTVGPDRVGAHFSLSF